MLNFISFGSGSSGNCYCLYNDTDFLMIDAGVGIRTLKRGFYMYGLSIGKVHNILITHDHADHVKTIGGLNRDYGVEVYSSQNVHAGIDRNYCVKPKIKAENKHYIKAGSPFSLDGFVITAYHVPHDSNDNMCYEIEYDGFVFALMTDVGHVTDEMKQVISRADYLVLEANHDEEMLKKGPYPEHLKRRIVGGNGHLSNCKCGETLVECASERLKHVWLCHLSEENNTPELALSTVKQTLEDSGVGALRNLTVEVLKHKGISGAYELR